MPLRTPEKMAYIEAILREPQIFQSFQKRFQYLESSGAILARSTRHRFGKSRIPKKLSQNRSKSAQNCSKLLTSAQNCSKSLTSAQNCIKFAFKSHISIIISTQYSNILAILREIGANIQYQYLERAKTILFGCLTHSLEKVGQKWTQATESDYNALRWPTAAQNDRNSITNDS